MGRGWTVVGVASALRVVACAVLLCSALPALAQGSEVEARAHFERGAALLESSQFAEAARELERALALGPTPAVYYNLGLAYRGTGAYGRAIRMFERFLELAHEARYLPTRKIVEQELEELRRARATLEVEVRGGATRVELDGRLVASSDGTVTLQVDPGSRRVTARRPGYQPATQRVSLGRGERQRVVLVADRTPLPARLIVEVDVPEATVFLGDQPLGRGRVERRVKPGLHQLRIEAPDYEPSRREIAVRPGTTERLSIELRRQTGILGQWWFWAGAVAVVGTATVATVFLLQPEREERYDGSLGVSVAAMR
jgi:hypothetical protein